MRDPQLETLVAEPSADFALLDSGRGRKLERCGPWRFIRPEPQAMWSPAGPDWAADGEFVGGPDEEGGGRWRLSESVPPSWPITQAGVQLHAQCTPFRHLGFFPDMAPHWDALAAVSRDADVLNLFGYTGVASLVAARAGARVVHVDASRKAVEQARANARLSGLADRPIRWLTEDARKFVAREVRRGRRYDAILLDPPKFGRGPDGEIWDLTEHLAGLLADCAQLLDAGSRLMVLTTYAVRLSALALEGLMQPMVAHLPGGVRCGEMAIREEGRGTLLPTAIFARWRPDNP
ncbi:MAG: class I SAM-dependent methyltransferase [Sandarakinorhabdus sp.]|nr:class I SAM-dependent methyltransferase [Sandarakinorhabdus sp.]